MKNRELKPERTLASNKVTSSQVTDSQLERILNFWFAPDRDAEGTGQAWSRWFVPDPDFDRKCKSLFLDSYMNATHARLDHWQKTPRTCLALVLLLDQLPRNMFRGTARAFATDAKAREASRQAIALGFDRELAKIMRMFFYLPFEHSEDLSDQLESVRLASLIAQEWGESEEGLAVRRSAELHLEIIRRFGRFPGRNQALGRQSTKQEIEFLKHTKAAF